MTTRTPLTAWVWLTACCAIAQPEKKALLIGIDGAGGRYVQEADTPEMDALAAAGVARYDFLNEGALYDNPPEGFGASGVNWSTFVTGAAAENHGVVDNSFGGSRFDEHPHFFKHVKDADPTAYTASLANWTPINTFILDDRWADLEVGYDSGSVAQQDAAVKSDAVGLIRFADPDAVFLHFDQVDSAGHSFSWGSQQHLAAINTVDGLVGEVIDAIQGRPGVASGDEDWLVLISSDHGATRGSFGHVASQGEPNWEVPYLAWGPSVQTDEPLGQGSLRDLASTALWHLGVDPFLAGLDGTIRGLATPFPSGVFGDLNGDGAVSGDGRGPAATDDVTRFLDNWLVSAPGGVNDRLARGDVNLDGVTDLADWAVINDLDPALGAGIGRALAGVPEPGSSVAALSAALLTMSVRRRA